jgi:hypothetical protein
MLMQIRLALSMTESPPVVSLLLLAKLLSVGNLGSKQSLHSSLLRQNTCSLLKLPRKLFGFVFCFRNLDIQNNPTVISEDNQRAINLSTNPGEHRKSKHIYVQYHFSHEKVESGEIQVVHYLTNTQMVDILTKPYTRELLKIVRDKLLHPF